MSPPARRLRLVDCLAIGVNGIVGGGIFVLPAPMAAASGPWSAVAFLVCGVFIACVGLCFAELASSEERSGGPYRYAREAFGDAAGFAVAWMAAASGLVAFAAVARTFAAYLGALVPAAAGAERAVAAALVVALGAANIAGARLGAAASNALAAAKLLPLALFAGVGAFAVDPHNLGSAAPEGWAGLGRATLLAVFALSGFEVVPVPAGETVDPRRAVPLALGGSILLATLLYAGVQAVAVGVHPSLASSPAPLADAAAAAAGEPGRALLAVGAVLSTAGFCAGVALATPRYLSSLAEDALLPPALARFGARSGAPAAAVALVTAVALVLAIAGEVVSLVDFTVAAIVAQYLPTCLAVLVLRRRRPGAAAFRVPLGPAIPVAAAAASAALIAAAGARQIAAAGAVLGAGLMVYAIARRRAEPG